MENVDTVYRELKTFKFKKLKQEAKHFHCYAVRMDLRQINQAYAMWTAQALKRERAMKINTHNIHKCWHKGQAETLTQAVGAVGKTQELWACLA